MKTFIALFRGLNVGGTGIVPMKDLAKLLSSLGFIDVVTYIQSGNAVFNSAEEDAPKLREKILKNFEASFGFVPGLIIPSLKELEAAMKNNPFPEAEAQGDTLHLAFLERRPVSADLPAIEKLRASTEKFVLRERVFYLHAPDGVGRSKLAAAREKLLGVPATDRNWRTVCKLRELAEERNSSK